MQLPSAMIANPGFHPEITPAQYFTEPCPQPALTNSGIKWLLPTGAAPAKFAHHHPAIGQPATDKGKSHALYMGGLVHRLALGKGDDYVLSPYADYRSKEARDWRDQQQLLRKVPVKEADHQSARAMATIIRSRIEEVCGGFDYQTEVVIAWQEDVALDDGEVVTIWCRAMLDFWCPDLMLAGDAKTTVDASDDSLNRWFWNSYSVQDCWYLRGLQKLVGTKARFGFLFVEKEEPYLYRYASSTDGFRQGAWVQIEKAMKVFATCLRDQKWPGYEPYEAHPTLWQMARMNDAEDADISASE